MQSALNVSLSAQIALEQRLATIADNIANMNTAGFRSTQVKFVEILKDIKNDLNAKVSFVSRGDEYLSSHAGALVKTGNPLDFALKGDAWFALQSPQGMILTRDGRFRIEGDGELVSSAGYPGLDVGNMPIQLRREAGKFEVNSDGSIYQDGKRIGAFGFYSVDLSRGFVRHANGITPTAQPLQILDRFDVSVKQGHIENSNTNAIYEISQLIQLQNEFTSIASLVSDSENSLLEAIKILSS